MNLPKAGSDNTKHLFNAASLSALLIPVIIEQILTALMGSVDTIMVSNVSPAAISAVSLVDSINILIIQALSALAAGGAIICAQYLGKKETVNANYSARQLVLSTTVISAFISLVFLFIRFPMLHTIFGTVEKEVMDDAEIYFFYTLMSYPFIALFNSGSAIFRAQKNSSLPLTAAVISNTINIFGNAFLMFVLHMGVAGAAIATLVSRIFSAVYVLFFLHLPKQEVSVRGYLKIRPDFREIKRILSIGIPAGIENSMFQFGKLAVQSTVSTMGTIAIAAEAMTNTLEALNGIAGIGVGIALMTVVGQCMGANRKDEAVYYIKKLTLIAEFLVTLSCLLFLALVRPITVVAGMDPESAGITIWLITLITCVKPIVWTLSFIPAYGMRAAGDVRFSMTVSCFTMWFVRVFLCVFTARTWHLGPVCVWIGMFADWTVRALLFSLRFRSRKWLRHKVI